MTTVTPRGKQTKLSSDAKQAKEWMSTLPDVENLFQLKSYDELSKIINDWLTSDEEEAVGTERGGTDNNTESETSEGDGSYKSLDDAFADLM